MTLDGRNAWSLSEPTWYAHLKHGNWIMLHSNHMIVMATTETDCIESSLADAEQCCISLRGSRTMGQFPSHSDWLRDDPHRVVEIQAGVWQRGRREGHEGPAQTDSSTEWLVATDVYCSDAHSMPEDAKLPALTKLEGGAAY